MPQFGCMRLLPLIGLLLLLGFGGCGDQKTIVGGKKAPKIYNRVVSLSPGATELASAKFGRIIAGRTASCNSPARIKEAPIVMKGVKPDYEKIVKIKPDAVIYDPELFSESDIAKFTELGIPTVAIGGDSVDAYIDSVYEFGRFTGAEELGSKYLDAVEAERRNALAVPLTPPVQVAIIMPGSGYEHMVAGTESFYADVVKCGGGSPVGPKGSHFMQLSAEWLIQANPELIITAGPPDSVLKDPRFKNLDAVKKNHVFGTNPDVTLRRGAYVDRFIKRVWELTNIVRK